MYQAYIHLLDEIAQERFSTLYQKPKNEWDQNMKMVGFLIRILKCMSLLIPRVGKLESSEHKTE